MPMKTQVICVLGSNRGCRRQYLRRAAWMLAATPGIELIASSNIYETPPWGVTDQPPYLNAAVQLITRHESEALLDIFQSIEKKLDRDRDSEERWGPRTVDLDMALYGMEIIQTERLTVPHLDLHRRAFALVPMLDVFPEAQEPETGGLYSHILQALPDEDQNGPKSIGPLIHDAKTHPASLIQDSDADTLWMSDSPEKTEHFAADFSKMLQGGEVIAMMGDLGAGKTCFARGLARGLDIYEPVVSPSYVLVRSYEGRLALHHADFYRLSSDSADADCAEAGEAPELASLGLDDYLDEPDAVVLVEWADHFPDWLEPPFYHIQVCGNGTSPRYLLVKYVRS